MFRYKIDNVKYMLFLLCSIQCNIYFKTIRLKITLKILLALKNTVIWNIVGVTIMSCKMTAWEVNMRPLV